MIEKTEHPYKPFVWIFRGEKCLEVNDCSIRSLWNRHAPALKNRCLCYFWGLGLGDPKAHLHIYCWYFCPRLHCSNWKKIRISRRWPQGKGGSEALLLRGTGALPLSPAWFLSGGPAPLSPSHYALLWQGQRAPSPHTCTFPHVASLLELLLLILWNPHHECHFKERFWDPCPLPLRQS